MEYRLDTEQLTPDEISQGWHYCYNWKGLLIGPGDQRMNSCECKINKKIHDQIKKTICLSNTTQK